MTFQNLIVKLKRAGKSPAPLFVFRATLLIVVLGHFSLIGLKQLPDNPINHQYKYELKAYMDPFFSQAWTLFAPNPINSNLTLMLNFRYTTPSKLTQDSSGWIDITAPIIEERKKNFFSAGQRINKFTTSSMEDVNRTYKVAYEFIQTQDSLKDEVKLKNFTKTTIDNSQGHQAILMYANHVAYKFFREKGVQPQDVQVAYRILNAKFPRFSKRALDYYEMKNYENTQITSEYYSLNHFNQL
ncbi:DUF5819 family protein [Marinoscillum sp.]|uniref:DUF5819 family protein n=1 Tax=Marinoscillum sp. TaxID=2024838 RepID=UPI003BAC402A